MAGKKISQLTGSLSPDLSGIVPIVLSGTTYGTTLNSLRQVLVDSGSHHFTGSQYINGSLDVSGSQYITDNLVIGVDVHHEGRDLEALHVANTGSINIAHFQGDQEYYTQVNLKNINSGSSASTDFVITSDNGDETLHYVNLGINSSTYNAGYVGYENDSYLLNVGKDLYIGTIGGTEHPSKLHLFSQNKWRTPQMTIHTGSQITFNTLEIDNGYHYTFSGSAKLQDNVTIDGFTILNNVTSSFNNDVEAEASGVPLNGLYRSGSNILIRLT